MVFEVILIACILIIILSILWSTLNVGISPMPSSMRAYEAVAKFTEDTGNGPIIDLGSGWGNVVIRLAKAYPEREVIGYELSLLPWFISQLLKSILRLKNLRIYRKNFLAANFADESVLICYLVPESMAKIQKKLKTEQHHVRYLISNNFALPLHTPEHTVTLNDFYNSPVYRYRMKAK